MSRHLGLRRRTSTPKIRFHNDGEVLAEDIFPYPSFRQGQKELAQSVYLACKNGERFVAEAMSGFGKTAAVLAGGISAATEDDLQIIYVCRTKRQVLRVLEELNRFSSRLPLRATSLFSKYDYCLSQADRLRCIAGDLQMVLQLPDIQQPLQLLHERRVQPEEGRRAGRRQTQRAWRDLGTPEERARAPRLPIRGRPTVSWHALRSSSRHTTTCSTRTPVDPHPQGQISRGRSSR